MLLQSDGTPWRPLVHIEDISRAFLAVMEAPRDVVHNQAFNVGATSENYRIREVAEMVQDVVPGSIVAFADGAGPDKRNYRVDCSRIEAEVPAATAQWTVRKGVEQIYAAIQQYGLDIDDLTGARFTRLKAHRPAALEWRGRRRDPAHRRHGGGLTRQPTSRARNAAQEPASRSRPLIVVTGSGQAIARSASS